MCVWLRPWGREESAPTTRLCMPLERLGPWGFRLQGRVHKYSIWGGEYEGGVSGGPRGGEGARAQGMVKKSPTKV